MVGKSGIMIEGMMVVAVAVVMTVAAVVVVMVWRQVGYDWSGKWLLLVG